MRERILYPFRPSPGERSLLVAGALIGVFGGILAFVTVTHLLDRGALWRVWSMADAWAAVSGMIGAGLALYLGRRWLGQPGATGTVRALVGIVWIGALAALIAGTLILPVYGTMFGPVLFGITILDHPLLALGWCYATILSHLLFREWRTERRLLIHRRTNWR